MPDTRRTTPVPRSFMAGTGSHKAGPGNLTLSRLGLAALGAGLGS